ncbi:MAG TPA: nitroreductase family protein [Acidimicrobiales bacterium]|nr:nitroreductase family protein [Acidimicrobiales bacterium]
MEFSEVVRRRRMVRRFDGTPVAREVVERLLRNAVRGPSAGFSQGFAFVVLEGEKQTRPFWDAVLDPEWEGGGWRTAPVVVVPLSNKQAYLDRYSRPDKEFLGMGEESAWPVPYWDIDAAFATMLLLLSVVEEGLGAVFCGIFKGEREALHALGVPESYRAIGAVALGHRAPDEHSRPSWKGGRKPFEEVVHFGRWSADDVR